MGVAEDWVVEASEVEGEGKIPEGVFAKLYSYAPPVFVSMEEH
jgi:hypothetical protein